MNVKKRLIKLFKKIEYTPFPEMTTKANLANQFTDYALNCIVDEMLANGVIAPPCKPGDKIYFPSYYKSGIRCGVVERIILDSKGMLIDVGYMKIDAGSFGVSVFTDYNEALRALEKEKLENEVRKAEKTIKDSGSRREFDTGAVRDMAEGKGRMDLLPWDAILEVSKHAENGAKKYGEHNVDKGLPVSSFCDSGMRHLAKHVAGWDDEPHLLAAAWNLLWAIQMELKHPEMCDIPWRDKDENKEENE